MKNNRDYLLNVCHRGSTPPFFFSNHVLQVRFTNRKSDSANYRIICNFFPFALCLYSLRLFLF